MIQTDRKGRPYISGDTGKAGKNVGPPLAVGLVGADML